MKSFKQFLRESEETKDHVSGNEEVKELDEAKMDWGNVVNEVTNTSLLVDIINKHSKPEIRVGDSSYVIKDLENPETLNSIRKKYGSISKLTDEQEEELKQDNINFLKDLEKMEANIQKDMIKITKKYEDEIKKVLKKYNAEI